MTQLQSAPASDCDTLLRQARELLDKGELALASDAGWRAAVRAMADYAGADADFTSAAKCLVKDYRGDISTAEWVVSAMALSDNAEYDWLDGEGIARRLDDVQRLVILVKDRASTPQSAETVLQRAWECFANGALAVASEKGWEAALRATKSHADAIGHEYRGEYHFDDVVRMLAKDDAWSERALNCENGALNLRQTATYYTVRPKMMTPEDGSEMPGPNSGHYHPRWLLPDLVAEDIASVAALAGMLKERSVASLRAESGNV